MLLAAFFVPSATQAHHRLSGEPFAAPVAMDFDADDRDDLLVRRPVFDPAGEAFGSVEIYCVHRRELLLLLNSEWPNDLFGFSAASAGDLTGDGFTDIVVGAPYGLWIDDDADESIEEGISDKASRRDGKSDEADTGDGDDHALDDAGDEPSVAWPHGRIDIFSGATGQLAMSLQHPDAYLLGRVVAGVGDVNSDGVPDIAASGYARDTRGNPHERVFIFCGLTGDAFRVFVPERSGEGFGHTIAGLGDLDGDGYADIAIGTPDAIADAQSNARGVIYVFRGEPMPEVAEVLLSDEPITQVRRAGRHAFTRIAAEHRSIEYARHIMPGPMVAVDATLGTMIDDPADTPHDKQVELIGTMLAFSLRFDEATRQTAWLAETIDPLTGQRLAHAELPRFIRGGDVTRDLTVGDDDLRALIAMLGITPDPADPFNADLTNNGTIDTADLERTIEHTGERHELLNLAANTGDAMFVVMDELELAHRLTPNGDALCTTPVRTKHVPGILVMCAGDALPSERRPPGVHEETGGAGEDSSGIGGQQTLEECCNACCLSGVFGGPDCCGGIYYPCSTFCQWNEPGDPPDYWFWWPGSGTDPSGGGGDPPGDPPGSCNYLQDPTCLTIPSQFDCDNPNNTLSQSYRDACCDTSPPTGGTIGSTDPEHPQDQDDDCDGTPNWADCDSDCYIGDPSTDCACQDDDEDGIKNQDTCGHACATPALNGECDSCDVLFKPDPSTHIESPTALMVLPGDYENLSIEAEDDPHDECEAEKSIALELTIDNPTVAMFLLPDGTFSETTSTSTPQSVQVIGIAPGTAKVEARRSGSDTACAEYPVTVGGEISISFTHAPTFEVLASDITPSSSADPTISYSDHGELIVGGALYGSGLPGARGGVPSSIIEKIAETSTLWSPEVTVTIVDAYGDPKPNKAVTIHSVNDLVRLPLVTAGIILTNQQGESAFQLSADSDKIRLFYAQQGLNVPFQEVSMFREDVAVLYGRTAQDYWDEVISDALIESMTNDPLTHFGDLTHNGEMFRWTRETTSTTLGNDHYSVDTMSLGIGNHIHMTILRSAFETGETHDLLGLAEFEVPSGELLIIDLSVDTSLFDAVGKGLVFDTFHDFALPLEHLSIDGTPGLGFDGMGAASLALEIGWGFVPVAPDILDIGRETYNSIVGNDVNEFLLAVSAFGLLADAGYIAGPAGVAGNLVASVLKVIARRLDQIDPQFLIVISKQAGSMREAATALGTYFARLPNPPGMSEAEWVVEVIEASMRKLSRVIASPIGIPIEKASEAILLLQRKGKKFYSDDAAEGVAAYLAKHAGDTTKGVEDTHDAMKASAIAKGFDPDTAQELADGSTESVFEAVGKYHRAGTPDPTGLQRIDEALAASKIASASNYDLLLDDYIGPDKAFKTKAEFESLRFMRAEDMTSGAKNALNALRLNVGMPVFGEPLVKVLKVDDAFVKLTANDPNLGGFFARQSDVTGLQTTQQLSDRLRLDYPGGFQDGTDHVILETVANAEIHAAAKIPRSSGFSTGGDLEFVPQPPLPYPHVGNGFTAARDGTLVPEWTTASVPMDPEVTVMRFRKANGDALPQTINVDGVPTTASDWMLIIDPVDPEKRKWVPAP